MDWIPTLLKHLAVSRSAVGAAFSTACVMYFGPRIAPLYVDPVPKEWAFAVVAVLVFSGFFILAWGAVGAFRIVERRVKLASERINSLNLSKDEIDFISALGRSPSDSLDLDRINYEAISLSRLEVLSLVHGLEKKGLVSRNPYSASELFSLTQSGLQRALEIQRSSIN